MKKQAGIVRLVKAFGNSLAGLQWMIRHESAFRQEIALIFLAIPALMFIDVSLLLKMALIVSLLLVLIVEALNTGIEAVVDRIGHEFHELSGVAKDCASAAVFISLLVMVTTWVAIIYSRYFL